MKHPKTTRFPPRAPARTRNRIGRLVPALALLLLAGCAAPIGADHVSARQAYAQVEANALRTGRPSAHTRSLLHRYNLDALASQHPDQAVPQLHEKARATGERDLLFALAELSYVAGEKVQRSVKPWDPRDPRDYYLGSAVYAWLFLFGESVEPAPSAFDRRFRAACDFYNHALGRALTERRNTNGVVRLEGGRRALPVGALDLQLTLERFPSRLEEFEQILLADRFRVRGLSVRNREPGLGAPLICTWPVDPKLGLRPCAPATVFLRGPASLAELGSGTARGSLEVFSAFADPTVTVNGTPVPLEIDLTTHRAYTLNQSKIWKLGKLQFLAPAERIQNQLILNQPYEPGCIPVVFVHGTFSSPVTWAELANALGADPVLRRRYQVWSFVYGSGNPAVFSTADLRSALTAKVQELDPAGTNAALRQMVIIGHSQGGLLTKGTVVTTGNRLWQIFSTNRVEDLRVSDAERAEIQRLLFYEPLPFVKRVVFIATPHRGSYLSGGLVRQVARWIVSLPFTLLSRGTDMLNLTAGSDAGEFLHGRMPTSLDSMSPKNPSLLALADLPVASSVKAHSIIPVLGEGDYQEGRDGVVAYSSAHLEGVASEFIVRSKHSCLDQPATIGEVRRILYEHLQTLSSSPETTAPERKPSVPVAP